MVTTLLAMFTILVLERLQNSGMYLFVSPGDLHWITSIWNSIPRQEFVIRRLRAQVSAKEFTESNRTCLFMRFKKQAPQSSFHWTIFLVVAFIIRSAIQVVARVAPPTFDYSRNYESTDRTSMFLGSTLVTSPLPL